MEVDAVDTTMAEERIEDAEFSSDEDIGDGDFVYVC